MGVASNLAHSVVVVMVEVLLIYTGRGVALLNRALSADLRRWKFGNE